MPHTATATAATGTPAALPTDKELVLKVIPMPGDTNVNGDIFGGWVMSQVDLAGCVLPMRLAQGRIDRGSGFFRWLHDESTPVVLGNNIGFYENIFKP